MQQPFERPETTVKLRKLRRYVQFFKIAMRDFIHSGTLFPSSDIACEIIGESLPRSARHVVEYGPGNGCVTHALLQRLPIDGRLTGIEINHEFAEALRLIADSRLSIVEGDVKMLGERLAQMSPGTVDAVVSGVPFSFLDRRGRDELIRSTYQCLRPGGRFVVYQNSPFLRPALEKVFGCVKQKFIVRNMPPYFLMIAEK